MAKEKVELRGRGGVLMVSLLGTLLVSLVGCASKQPSSPATTVTPEQVRGHADKTFDKLKQEERDRTADPASTSY